MAALRWSEIPIVGGQTAVRLPAIDHYNLTACIRHLVRKLAAKGNAGLVVIGERLGLYGAMAGAGPIGATKLADRTSTIHCYVREWLNTQAGGGYAEYDAVSDGYSLSPERALAEPTIDDPMLGAPADRRLHAGGPGGARPSTRANLFDRILVAVGDDAASAAAVRAAIELAVKMSSEVLAVHVWSHDLPRLGPSAAECGLREDDPSLERALHDLREAGVRHRGERWQAIDGRVLEALLQAANEYDASLAIIGTNRRSGLRGRLRRELGLSLAARTSRPVLIVR